MPAIVVPVVSIMARQIDAERVARDVDSACHRQPRGGVGRRGIGDQRGSGRGVSVIEERRDAIEQSHEVRPPCEDSARIYAFRIPIKAR